MSGTKGCHGSFLDVTLVICEIPGFLLIVRYLNNRPIMNQEVVPTGLNL